VEVRGKSPGLAALPSQIFASLSTCTHILVMIVDLNFCISSNNTQRFFPWLNFPFSSHYTNRNLGEIPRLAALPPPNLHLALLLPLANQLLLIRVKIFLRKGTCFAPVFLLRIFLGIRISGYEHRFCLSPQPFRFGNPYPNLFSRLSSGTDPLC